MSEPKLDSRPALAGHGRLGAPLADLVRRARPALLELFARHRLPEARAEEILRSTLQALAWKWESVRNREAWLLAVMERKCRLASGDREAGGE